MVKFYSSIPKPGSLCMPTNSSYTCVIHG